MGLSTKKKEKGPASLLSQDNGQEVHHTARRSKAIGFGHVSSIPVAVGSSIALLVLLLSAGATIFFLSRPSDSERLFQEGRRQLANGQYAFAVRSLEQALMARQSDSRILLTLARAYVGIDQVDKAWDCITQAQQLGTGVVAEPALASDLANYYRQRGQYQKATELLRPLAQANIADKKSELADLAALWGDQELQEGSLDTALACWEEVRDLREGSRFAEAESRLATIYQRMVNKLLSEKDDTKAQAYLIKLNTIAESASNYERIADIYERRGQLDIAIDQLRRALKLPAKSPGLEKHLSSVMMKRGKELLDKGDTQAGYGYLQEARGLDATNTVPTRTLRNVIVSIDNASRCPRITGEIWNPGPDQIQSLTLKVELWQPVTAKVLWEKEQKLIDEFVPPLLANGVRPFDVLASIPVRADGQTEFHVYIEGGFYRSYPIGTKLGVSSPEQSGEPKSAEPVIESSSSETTSSKKLVHPEDETLKDLEP
ncbi:MAG: hypothetical protein HY711_10125 [Candidatus Melainabacteria bacterium]|nr:hypothetical protein [Candidatus Melainabacteria bacterium]